VDVKAERDGAAMKSPIYSPYRYKHTEGSLSLLILLPFGLTSLCFLTQLARVHGFYESPVRYSIQLLFFS